MVNELDILHVLNSISRVIEPRVTDIKFISSSTTGTIAEGAHTISVANRGGATGTVTSNGTTYTLAVGEAILLDPGYNRRIGVITYDGTGTTLKFIITR